jgi:hypothetical protein
MNLSGIKTLVHSAFTLSFKNEDFIQYFNLICAKQKRSLEN